MRLGLLSDIHEDVAGLCWAIQTLQSAGVEQFVCLGDVSEDGEAIDETCAILAGAGVVGVWGNHDFGLCTAPMEVLADRFSPEALAYIRSYQARLSFGDCHFCHIEPCLDPRSGLDLWEQPSIPDSPERLAWNWEAVPERLLFMGHLHRWFAASSRGALPWSGERALSLAGPERFFVVVGAVCDGYCALVDTTAELLVPFTRDRA